MELNPRDVLHHLNQMGYRHITAEQLKAFMIDLRKLIKYEASQKCSRPRDYVKECLANLESTRTTQKETQKPAPSHSPVVPEITVEKPQSRPSSRPVSAASSKGSHAEKENPPKKAKMWIRTPRPSHLATRNDPVDLYHKYQKEWQRHKDSGRIPGENDHAELRWQIRSKLLGAS